MPPDPPKPDDDEPDDDTLAAFTKILTKVGPKWLEEQMKAATPTPPADDAKRTVSLEAFLQETLKETKKSMEAMADQLEAMREVLTPEQWTQVKSAQAARVAGGATKPAETPPKSEPPAKPTPVKRKWL